MEKDKLQYSMNENNNKKGVFVILNNKKFHPQTGFNERTGTDVDYRNLVRLFQKLGFIVYIQPTEMKDGITCAYMRQFLFNSK